MLIMKRASVFGKMSEGQMGGGPLEAVPEVAGWVLRPLGRSRGMGPEVPSVRRGDGVNKELAAGRPSEKLGLLLWL